MQKMIKCVRTFFSALPPGLLHLASPSGPPRTAFAAGAPPSSQTPVFNYTCLEGAVWAPLSSMLRVWLDPKRRGRLKVAVLALFALFARQFSEKKHRFCAHGVIEPWVEMI